MVKPCPYCGCIPEQPVLFSIAVQQVFNYIWNHPGCTKIELEKKFYARVQSNSVAVHLSTIRNQLESTDWRLIGTDINSSTPGHKPKTYEIINITKLHYKAELVMPNEH